MATTRTISGNSEVNNGGIALGLPSDGPTLNAFTHAQAQIKDESSHAAILAVSPTQSGNVGGIKALTGGVFNSYEEGEYVAKIIGTRIAQTDDTVLQGGNASVSERNMLRYWQGDQRYDIGTLDIYTGTFTKGNNAGDAFDAVQADDGSTATSGEKPTNAIPGRFVYRNASLTVVEDTFNPRNE